jgi:uncharacterized protein
MTNNIIFDVIIYHDKCPDGITGLWSAYHYAKLNSLGGFEAHGISAGTDPTKLFEDKHIIFIDICPSINYIVNVAKSSRSITILDHHKSSYEKYMNDKYLIENYKNLTIEFDGLRSGCQMAWDYFFPDKERPWFINYVADRDLWTWLLPFSKEINTALSFNNVFDATDLEKLENLLNKNVQYFIVQGQSLTEFKNKILQDELNKSFEADFISNENKYRVQVGAISSSDMKSDFGNLLATKPLKNGELPAFGVVWTYNPLGNEWYVSLRGSDTSPDLTIIASQFGGGGHMKASGFCYKENIFMSIIKI